MNARIKELAEQAGFVDKGNNITTYLNFDHEKFTELIVRECIDVIGEENYTMLTGKAYSTQLKRHFGV